MLLLSPIGSYWLPLAPIGSYWLLLAPIGSYWLLFAPIGSSWLLLAPMVRFVMIYLYFLRTFNALPVHLARQVFDRFWDPLGTNFGSILVTFSSFGPPNCSTDSIVVFLLIWEQTWHQDATPGSLQNIVNTMVFVRFTV